MTGFKYETFEVVPSGGGLGGLRNSMLERERDEAYARGFKDGVNVTKKAVDVERNVQLDAISNGFNELTVSHEIACANVMGSIGPLLKSIIAKVAPTLSHTTWSDTLCEHVTDALHDAATGKMLVKVCSSQTDAIIAEFNERGLNIDVEGAPTLQPFSAECHWNEGVDVFNLADKIEDINAIISEFLDQIEETPS